MKQPQELMAFWMNGGLSPVLSGVVSHWTDSGNAAIGSYGPGFVVKPVLILPKKQGVEVAKKIKELEEEHRNALYTLNSAYRDKVIALVPGATL